jgi:DNA mismatch endonuclease (patch repair protein)
MTAKQCATASPPVASSAAVSRKFSRQRSYNTAPEIVLRKALHRRGLRYRLHQRPVISLRRTADIVFPKAKLAVEVRGCFWHACPQHRTVPQANHDWWAQKLAHNQERDNESDRIWRASGWEVVIVWEHDDPEKAADQVALLVSRRRLAMLRSTSTRSPAGASTSGPAISRGR